MIKLIVSHDLPCSTAAIQITFDRQDWNSIPDFECSMNRHWQALFSNLEAKDTITFT